MQTHDMTRVLGGPKCAFQTHSSLSELFPQKYSSGAVFECYFLREIFLHSGVSIPTFDEDIWPEYTPSWTYISRFWHRICAYLLRCGQNHGLRLSQNRGSPWLHYQQSLRGQVVGISHRESSPANGLVTSSYHQHQPWGMDGHCRCALTYLCRSQCSSSLAWPLPASSTCATR